MLRTGDFGAMQMRLKLCGGLSRHRVGFKRLIGMFSGTDPVLNILPLLFCSCFYLSCLTTPSLDKDYKIILLKNLDFPVIT